MDIVDTEKKKTIRDNINVSDKVTLTRALQPQIRTMPIPR